jgi:hypothetical protein
MKSTIHYFSISLRISCFIAPCLFLGIGNGAKGAYLPVEIFARTPGENTTASPLAK